ncbi:MAG: flavin-containing monooxygenase [Acidimicrobiales bacterium]
MTRHQVRKVLQYTGPDAAYHRVILDDGPMVGWRAVEEAGSGAHVALDVGRRQLAKEVRTARSDGRTVPSVIIVGGGMSGLAMAMQLVRSGVRDFTIVEQSDQVGGTWRDNTYPGSGCDVPSHLYSFSFAPKSDWSRRFAEQPEILTYVDGCVEHFHLGPHLRLGSTVHRAVLDETSGRWQVEVSTAEGRDVLEADVVVFACGQLNRPHLPDLEGVDRFAGPAWHSARWDHSEDLAGRRVAVVGSGASAIQFVPVIAEAAAELTIYQRTPNYVAPKKDRTYSSPTHWVMEHVRAAATAYRWWIYWSLELRWLCFRKDSRAGRWLTGLFAKGIRSGVVSDRLPEASVIPDYPIGCKRILISSDWYPTLERSNVHVVDQPIERIEADGIVTTDGRRRPADVLIFGTGFSTTEFLSHIDVTGTDGRSLAREWEQGAHAYLGVSVPSFPNCFFLYGPNTNLGHNSILFMVERQINLILQAMTLQTRAAGSGGLPLVGVGDDAYRLDDERTQRLMTATAWVAGCRSWYKDASGRVVNNWPTWTVRYWYETLRLRTNRWSVLRDDPHRDRAVATAASGPLPAAVRPAVNGRPPAEERRPPLPTR